MMKLLRKVIVTAGAAAGATAIALAAALPASAATQAPAPSGHGNYEWISGFLAGPGALANAPVVPLQLSGAVNTSGHINLGGNAPISPIWTNRGTLTVHHGNPTPPPQLNHFTCRVTETITTSYQVIGSHSSGVFHGASGFGRAVVVFSAIAPRYTHGPHRGQCNFSPNAPTPHNATISFNAQGPLFIRHH